MIAITRLFSDEQGHTHFQDSRVPLEEAGTIGSLSKPHPVSTVIFREVPPTYDYDFHTAPQRQYLVLLDGEIEIETSLGEKRTFKGGDILLLEDITGHGHRTKNILQATRRSIFITL